MSANPGDGSYRINISNGLLLYYHHYSYYSQKVKKSGALVLLVVVCKDLQRFAVFKGSQNTQASKFRDPWHINKRYVVH